MIIVLRRLDQRTVIDDIIPFLQLGFERVPCAADNDAPVRSRNQITATLSVFGADYVRVRQERGLISLGDGDVGAYSAAGDDVCCVLGQEG